MWKIEPFPETIYNFILNGTEKEKAIIEYRAYIKRYGTKTDNPYILYMKEVDNSCPDLTLKYIYKQKILKDNSINGDTKLYTNGTSVLGAIKNKIFQIKLKK